MSFQPLNKSRIEDGIEFDSNRPPLQPKRVQPSFGTSAKHLPYKINPESNRAHFYETHWKQTALDLLLRHCLPAGLTLLDYGSGRGETVALASRVGFAATGADVDGECVRLTSRHGHAVPLDAVDPVGQFGVKSFDVVTCFHVLEHVENPRKTLGELACIARQFVVLAVPNLRQLQRVRECSFDLSEVNEGHLQGWDHWHLRNLAERHCDLRLLEWASDATLLPVLSMAIQKLLGNRAAIALETGPFRRLFPYHCISVIGLFSPVARG
jgi:SAM-dependent methyltransferase